MYRWAEHADKAAVMKLWAIDFESYEPYYSWYFNTVYRPELTLCDFENGVLAANLQLAPYTLHLRGVELKICYMVGVITNPSFRKQGRGAALLKQAHEYLRRQNYAASLLYTDIPDFYAPLGYSHCYWQQTLRLPGDALALAQIKKAPPLQERYLFEETAALADIYQRMTASYSGYICRSMQNWRVYLEEQNCDQARLLLWPDHAYVIYKLDKKQLQVLEMGFCDEQAMSAALYAAAQIAQAAGVEQLLWHAPGNAPQLLPHIPGNYWLPRPFAMACLHDWAQVLKTIAYPQQAQAEILLNIREYEQKQSCLLSVADGRAQLQTVPSAEVPQLSLNIAELTRLVFGVPGAIQTVMATDPEIRLLLAEIFPPQPLWVNEYT